MSDVIDLFAKKAEKKKETAENKPKEEFDFEAVMKQNKENEKRKKQERDKANKGIKRSHRLKKK